MYCSIYISNDIQSYFICVVPFFFFIRSFGHHQAKQYNVNTGFTHLSDEDNTTVKHGFCKTRISVTKVSCISNLLRIRSPHFLHIFYRLFTNYFVGHLKALI